MFEDFSTQVPKHNVIVARDCYFAVFVSLHCNAHKIDFFIALIHLTLQLSILGCADWSHQMPEKDVLCNAPAGMVV